MAEPSPTAVHPSGPRELSTRWFVVLVAGLCVLGAVLGAAAKNYGPELGGDVGLWAGWAASFGVMCLACGVIARRVGNRFTPILCGLFVGLAAAEPAKELGRRAGGWWETVAWFPVFFAVYLLWVTVIHPRLAGRRTP